MERLRWTNENDYKQYMKIFEMLKDDNFHELDIPKMIPWNHSCNYDKSIIEYIMVNIVVAKQLKILRLPEFVNCFTFQFGNGMKQSIKIGLNDGLEELYINHIQVLNWISYLPFSLKKIVVDTEDPREEINKYINKLPYGCIIQYEKYVYIHMTDQNRPW